MPKYLKTADVLLIPPKDRPRFADGSPVRSPRIEPTQPEPKPEPAQPVAPAVDMGEVVAAIHELGAKFPVAVEPAKPVRRTIETTFRVTKRDDDGRVKEFKVVEVIEKD